MSLFVVEEEVRTVLRVAIVAQLAIFADADMRDACAELPDLLVQRITLQEVKGIKLEGYGEYENIS